MVNVVLAFMVGIGLASLGYGWVLAACAAAWGIVAAIALHEPTWYALHLATRPEAMVYLASLTGGFLAGDTTRRLMFD